MTKRSHTFFAGLANVIIAAILPVAVGVAALAQSPLA